MAGNIVDSFIGSYLQVIQGNPTYVGLFGRVIDDRKNSFLLEVNGDKKIVLKKGTVFMINQKIVRGDALEKKLSDRIKLRR